MDTPLEPLHSPLQVRSLNNQKLSLVKFKTAPVSVVLAGNHCELISFYVIDQASPPIVLGFPWLQKHNPRLDWKRKEIISWDPSCHESCLRSAVPSASPVHRPPDPVKLENVPHEYHDLAPVFSKESALSYHRTALMTAPLI